MLVGVITGDLVGSTAATSEAVDRSMSMIERSGHEADTASRFSRHRGDGWQMLVPDPGCGLSLVIWISAQLRAANLLSSRMALGIGAGNRVGNDPLGSASGPAFTASGRALDNLHANRWFSVAGEGIDPVHQALFHIVEDLVRGWSHEQAEAMAMALSPDFKTQSAIAGQIGVSRQAVSYRLRGAGLFVLQDAAEAFMRKYRTSCATRAAQ
jgi:hypothetical protein